MHDHFLQKSAVTLPSGAQATEQASPPDEDSQPVVPFSISVVGDEQSEASFFVPDPNPGHSGHLQHNIIVKFMIILSIQLCLILSIY